MLQSHQITEMDSVTNTQHKISAEAPKDWAQTTRSSNAMKPSKGNCSKHKNSKDNARIQYNNSILTH